jgi:hypothetical protein
MQKGEEAVSDGICVSLPLCVAAPLPRSSALLFATTGKVGGEFTLGEFTLGGGQGFGFGRHSHENVNW